ncbi:MAG TPA: DMT family transporter [Actinomycetota bacterium]|nr:DMT family transporter [Actinomycetota bacterium]
MDPAAVALVLAAAVLHASWNVRLHGEGDRVAAMAASGLVSGVVLLPFLVLDPPSGLWLLVLISGVAEAVYGLALAGAYRRGELTVTYPVGRGSAPLMTTLAAVAVVGQPATLRTLVAASLVAAGLGLLALRSHRHGSLAATGLALAVGAMIATYSVVDARAMRDGAAPLAYLAATLGLEGLVVAATTGFDVGRLRAALRPGAAIALGSVGAYALVLLAFQLAPVGRVATLREISIVVAVLLAREHPGPLGWAGIGAVVTGGALAAL